MRADVQEVGTRGGGEVTDETRKTLIDASIEATKAVLHLSLELGKAGYGGSVRVCDAIDNMIETALIAAAAQDAAVERAKKGGGGMIKRTMQEWADFTGCYAIRDDEPSDVFLCTAYPTIDLDMGGWLSHNTCLEIDSDLVADFAEHDWRVLVEPHSEASHE